MADDPFAVGETKKTQPLVWPPENAETLPDLPRFAVEVVTIDELALLVANTGLDPLTYKSNEPAPRFVLHDATGKRAARLGPHESTTRLAQALHAVIKSGEVAAAGAKGE